MSPEELRVHRELEYLRSANRPRRANAAQKTARRKRAALRWRKLQQARRGA